jgi:hypothetical protein
MANSSQIEEKAERIPRGSAPPALKLSDAVALVHKIYNKAGGSASNDTFSQIIGNTTTSSAFIRKLSAMRLYGLIDETSAIIMLTDLGNRIAAPRDIDDDLAAMKEAMLRVDTLNKIYERFKGRILPEDQFLKNILIQEFKVPREVATLWMFCFNDAATASHLLHQRSDGRMQVLEGLTASPNNVNDSTPPSGKKEASAYAVAPPVSTGVDSTADLILIQLGRGRLVKLQLPEDWESGKDLKRLLKMLSLALSDEIPEEEP